SLDGDLKGLTDGELTDLCDVAHAMIGNAQHLFMEALAEQARRGAGKVDGARSQIAWAEMRYHMATGTARAYTGTARRLADLPAVSEAFSDGTLDFDQVVAVARMGSRKRRTLGGGRPGHPGRHPAADGPAPPGRLD